MAHKANGETDKAIVDFQKIVDANPNDVWAKGQLRGTQEREEMREFNPQPRATASWKAR
jgi:hypothetical protein